MSGNWSDPAVAWDRYDEMAERMVENAYRTARRRRTCDECGMRRMTTSVEAGPGVLAYFCRDCLNGFAQDEEMEQAYREAMRTPSDRPIGW